MRITAKNSVVVTLIATFTFMFGLGAIMAGTAALAATAFGTMPHSDIVGVPAFVAMLIFGLVITTVSHIILEKAKTYYV